VIDDLAKAALLGFVQGLTEFLPVSSTGHLVLTQHYLGIDQRRYGLPFDAALHLGTLLSLLLYFRLTWIQMASSLVESIRSGATSEPGARVAWLVILGTVPAVVAGYVLESTIETAWRSPALVGLMLVVFSIPFVLAEHWGKCQREENDLGWRDSLFIGAAQALALIPGVSRSGMTISAGLLVDLRREDAARFAFLLSAPIIAGAGAKQLLDTFLAYRDGALSGDDAAFFATGFVLSALVGYAAISVLMRVVVGWGLMPFVFYRVALGLAVLTLAIATSVT